MDENPYKAPQAPPRMSPRRWFRHYRLTPLQANAVIAAVWGAIIALLAWYLFQPLS
jgi:hypothetical protein